ncbi:MAG: hypothetical protein LQ350_004349 [Teloschistes chrysophthalmus]|nr:MAG: hypothetical protein LQ350_004349 [Niorma chrysophthalma]
MTKSDSPSSPKKDLKSGRETPLVLSIDSIFEDYIIESATANNIINLQVSLAHLNRALRSAMTASSASLRLTKKNDVPVLSLTILTTTLAAPFARNPVTSSENGRNNENPRRLPSEAPPGDADSIAPAPAPAASAFDRETTITQSIPVTVLNPVTVANIHEPTCREPDVHILLPPLLQLKSVSERFVRLASPSPNSTTTTKAANASSSFTNADTTSSSSRLTLSASPFGELKIGVATPALKIESKWEGLVNPALDPGQVEGGEEGVREHASTRMRERGREAWAKVRVEGRDWGKVLGVGRLGGRVVACMFHARDNHDTPEE